MFDFFKSYFGMGPVLGVDIGTAAIKIVEVEKTSALPKLLNYGILKSNTHLDRPNSAIQSSALKIIEKETAELLKILLKEADFKSREAFASVPVFSAFITLLEMPQMPEADIAKAMAFQIKQHIPLPVSEVAIDWLKVGDRETEEGIKQQILLISIPNEIIKRYQNIFKLAGLKLKALEIESLSLARALVGNNPAPTLLIDIGACSTNIAVIDQGFVKLNVFSDIGGASLTMAIANGLGINVKRAEELKKQKGLRAGMAEYELSTLPLPYLDAIMGEGIRAKNKFEKEQGKKIEKILLAGGSANLLGIDEYFTKQMNSPVSIGNALLALNHSSEIEILAKQLGAELAIATGLAIKEF
jgi:type IV pilus assembly protein PilM